MERSEFEGVIHNTEKGCNESIIVAMREMGKYATVSLKQTITEENTCNIFYECDVNELLNSDVTDKNLTELIKEYGWEMSEDESKMIKYI